MSEGKRPKRATGMVRVYRGDIALIARTVLRQRVKLGTRLAAADIIHDLCEPLRRAEQEQERGQ